MYADPSRIRKHIVKVRLSDEEHRLIEALNAYFGGQVATMMRELAIAKAAEILSPSAGPYEGAISGSIGA